MIKMKECKLCGGTPYIESIYICPKETASYYAYFAVCNHCGARTKSVPSRLMAILQWNNLVKS